LVIYLYNIGILNAKTLPDRIPQIPLPYLELSHRSVPARPGHLVGGETNDHFPVFAQLKSAPEQGDMSVMNGIEGASNRNSGHTGPQTREPYKYLAA